MKATLKALLVGSVALIAVPQMSNAFSLRSMIDNATSANQPVRPEVGVGTARPNVVLAQAGDATIRIGQLEEEVRKLNGKIEDLAYQMLQMQEQMRQMQKDNEFRFQRLEGGSGGGATTATGSNDRSENATGGNDIDLSGGALPGVSPSTTASTSRDRGAPPRPLGTLTMDENGNPVGETIAPPPANPTYGGTETAALPPSSPEDIYRNAYSALLQGNYQQAERGFKDYIDILPDGPKAADASFWLGESEFSQGKFNEAAKTFLDTHQKYPKAEKAPETLLKLGMSLAALDNRDTACATYREVLKRYPNASPSVRKKVASEQSRAGC